jgi:hypothetical protein
VAWGGPVKSLNVGRLQGTHFGCRHSPDGSGGWVGLSNLLFWRPTPTLGSVERGAISALFLGRKSCPV